MGNEEDLSIEALKSGNQQAFAEMVDQYAPRIYRLALNMMDDPHEAEDVLQETFLNAYKGLPNFEGRSSVGTWLYRIASNQALMRLRKNQPTLISVDETITGTDGEEMPRQFEDWCCLPEEEFMSAEAQDQMENAARQLSPALRAVFILRDLHRLSTRETADLLKISEAAVKTRLLRARLQLREQLSEYFNERLQQVKHD